MEYTIKELIDKLIGHTDIACDTEYDNISYDNMQEKFSIYDDFLADIGKNLLFMSDRPYTSANKLRRQAEKYIKAIKDNCEEILKEYENNLSIEEKMLGNKEK